MNNHSPTLLCVDDDPEVLEVMTEHLGRAGFQVITARNGVEALFQVSRHSPKAVILDVFMPRLGGLPALDRIRRLNSSIVIILMSGAADALELIAETGVSVGGVLTKPLEPPKLVEMLVQAGVSPNTSPVAPSPDNGSNARRRILVVDDEPEMRELLIEYLERKGFEAAGARNGEEALRQMPGFHPGVVLLDIRMPGLSGVETLRRIKALPQEACVVMVSGVDDLATARQTLAMGAADYVAKPVDFAYLTSVLDTHFFMTEV